MSVSGAGEPGLNTCFMLVLGRLPYFVNCAPVAELVEHWAVMGEVVSLALTGPSLKVLK